MCELLYPDSTDGRWSDCEGDEIEGEIPLHLCRRPVPQDICVVKRSSRELLKGQTVELLGIKWVLTTGYYGEERKEDVSDDPRCAVLKLPPDWDGETVFCTAWELSFPDGVSPFAPEYKEGDFSNIWFEGEEVRLRGGATGVIIYGPTSGDTVGLYAVNTEHWDQRRGRTVYDRANCLSSELLEKERKVPEPDDGDDREDLQEIELPNGDVRLSVFIGGREYRDATGLK